MIRFKNLVTINRAIQDVFAFISNFENMPKWNYYVIKVEKITDGPIGVGTVYNQWRKTDRQQYSITEFEPNRRVTVKTLPPEHPLEMRFTLQSVNGGTSLEDAWELETGYPFFLERLATGRIKSAAKENLNKLKELLERGEVYLQDGRYTNIRP